jgi:L-alanine-DL-glutamate epimerase-like enolase superfamily enzyme
MAKIARLEVIPLAAPVQTADDLDGTTETVVVRVFDEDGRSGIGETDAPATVVKSFLEMPTQHLWSRNMSEVLIGGDPIELAAIWQRM